jgi:SpoVK/Ycf46/Vps4 family AAA+-type ATPase
MATQNAIVCPDNRGYMAKAEQIIELLKSHISGDDGRFFAVAMQVAAHEAQQGHEKLALELKALIDKAKDKRSAVHSQNSVVSLIQPKGELASLLSAEYPEITFTNLAFSESIADRFQRIILEQRQQNTLSQHGLKARRKILLYGPPGTGKTITASALAGELQLPLFTIRLDGLITKYMGETASKLRLIFDTMRATRAVYFFDEFDAIGGDRNIGNDVGEIRRVLNSFLQFMEQDQSESVIIAATNYVKLLDTALFRRFDDVIEYSMPDKQQIERVIRNRLHAFKFKSVKWPEVVAHAEGLSHAEVTRASDEAAKQSILKKFKAISQPLLIHAIDERKNASIRHNS